ncbi:hypothetical protein G6F35_017595 [Rhizopus arrhizus]|nr:hypothetical protein G6F35_017595 [Rhizopus arrhizus]
MPLPSPRCTLDGAGISIRLPARSCGPGASAAGVGSAASAGIAGSRASRPPSSTALRSLAREGLTIGTTPWNGAMNAIHEKRRARNDPGPACVHDSAMLPPLDQYLKRKLR